MGKTGLTAGRHEEIAKQLWSSGMTVHPHDYGNAVSMDVPVRAHLFDSGSLP